MDVVSALEAADVRNFAPRGAAREYCSAPLESMWQHPPCFHNGSAKTMKAVASTYNPRKSLGLSESQISDVAEYLQSL